MEHPTTGAVESLTEISAGAVVRRLREYNQLWTLEIPSELHDILRDAWIKWNKIQIRSIVSNKESSPKIFFTKLQDFAQDFQKLDS